MSKSVSVKECERETVRKKKENIVCERETV